MAVMSPVFSPKSPGTTTTILHPSGAEGGVEAITARRRNSGSFKHMSTGGLVSNSPFTARLGGIKSPPSSPTKSSTESRIPQPQSLRKTSASRRASGDHATSGPVKENSNPSDLNELAGGTKSPAQSPLIAFRSLRPATSASPVLGSPLQSSAAFKPTRPTFSSAAKTVKPQPSLDEADFNRRQSSSYAALRKNGGLVSSSPFTNGQARSPVPPAQPPTIPSPEIQQVPYEIGALSHESAPFGYHDLTDEPVEHESTLPTPPSKASGLDLGLGARPGSQWSQTHDRRVIASGHIPTTPPRTHVTAESGAMSPNGSALSPLRRGIRGPRPMGLEGDGDEGEETEREETISRPLRRQPSNKTVTWAETEEVLEFEVEEERRRSMMSDASTGSEDDRRYYNHDDSSDDYEDDDDTLHSHRPYQSHPQEYSFQEGGSIEVHEFDESDAEESVVSTTSSAMDDMIEQIDDFIQEESFDDQTKHQPRGYSARSVGPASASTVLRSAPADDIVSEVNSASSYDDDEEDVLRSAKQYLLSRSAISSNSARAPGSPQRPQLPSPPTPTAPIQAAPPIPAELPHLGAVSSSSGMQQSDSQYSLPDIPGTSPFLGFDDESAGRVTGPNTEHASIAVTQPLSPRRTPLPTSPPPNQLTPTAASSPTRPSFSSRQASDSPILSAFDRLSLGNGGETSPHLSRKASLIGSDVTTTSSISWYGSGVNGSLRGGTVRLGRDRLDERMKAHQALLGGSPTAFGAFPTLTSPDLSLQPSQQVEAVGPFSHEMDHTQSAPASSALLSSSPSRAIEAKPASKPRSATLSSSMLPTIAAAPQRTKLGLSVGAPLTADVAEEMTSPLDRLQRGMEGRGEGSEWRSGDSLLGVADLAKDHSGDESRDHATNMMKSASEPRPRRRRSRSTGDADVAETASAPMEVMHTMPELGFQKKATDAAFASNVLESLDDIYNSRNRTYRVRESKQIVVVSDINGHRAGDVDPGRAWRKKRPSNVHDVKRSGSTVSVNSRRLREHSGQLFVCLRDVTFEGVPMPREKVSISASLDNGRQRVEAAVRELGPKVSLKKEFELVCSENLAFSIHFTVSSRPPSMPSVPAPSPPLSPSKTSRGFRIFSSPKKKATPTRPAAPPPTPDPFYDYLASDGKLATASISFIDQVSKCRLKKARIVVPFAKKEPASPRSCGGSLTLDLLFVPSVPGVPKGALAKSMDEVTEGLDRADWATKITHEGVLTQLGGDCTVWRRRNIKLRGNTLVPYSEVTKRSHVEINLASVAAIEDLNAHTPSTPGSRMTTSYDEDEDVGRMDNSFRLAFKDGGRIDFFADSVDAKKLWLDVLRQVAGTDAKKCAPEWAVAVRKLTAPAKP
ncbi:uncharacterized protein JCM15063_003564 [Sporobolomyces koalae]|uniref:uncharacterized protein n=1 Tax=Sporobolomyces koalae TaxID=500713 RepID=UPI003172AC46